MRSLKLISAFFAVLTVIIVSCNKKNNNNTPASPGPTPTPTPATGYYGEFEHRKAKSNTSTDSMGVAWAMLYDIPFSASTASLINYFTVDAGDIYINGLIFTKSTASTNVSYMGPSTVTTNQSQWVTTGSGTVPAISYTDNNPWPTFTGDLFLPDTIRTTQTNTITIQGAGGADEIEVTLVSGPNWYQKIFPANTTSVVVTVADLSGHIQNNSGFMQIIPKKKTIQSFSGKPYQFVKTYAWQRTVYFK